MVTDIYKELEEAKQQLEKVKEKFKSYCLDSNNPLEERWKIITEGFGETSWRTDFNIGRDDEFLYESPCYMEKYEERRVEDILEALENDEDFNLTEEEKVKFKEYCCENFISSMKFDW